MFVLERSVYQIRLVVSLNGHSLVVCDRRTMHEIVCITPPAPTPGGHASIKLFIDKAEITNPDVRYSYSEDPTIATIEPNWSIVK